MLHPTALKIIVFVLVAFTSLAACSQKISFATSPVVPAARGTVTMKKDDNQNYHIQIALANLAEPGRLPTPKKTYVVWMETADKQTKNIGQINTSGSLLSSKLRSSFETVTPERPIRIFISAEDEGAVQYPSELVILTTGGF